MNEKSSNQGIYITAGILAGACCAVMVVFPEMALASAEKGLRLWAESVLPAMLPFFICANFLVASGFPALAGRLFERPFRHLFRAPGTSAFVFMISITSGYPMGPKMIGELSRRGEITAAEAKRMLTFCSTSGPLFLLGTVGVSMLGSPEAGMTIALTHYGGALLNGWITGLWTPDIKARKKYTSQSPCPPPDIVEALTEAIFSALKTLGLIAGYIVLFTIAADFLETIGAFRILPYPWGKGILSGILEVTVGCSSLGGTGLPAEIICCLCAFLVSFGGLSVMAQSMSVLSGSGIRPLYYLKTKLTHGLLSATLAWFISPLFLRSTETTGAFGNGAEGEIVFFPWLFSSQLLILVLIFLFISIFFGHKKAP